MALSHDSYAFFTSGSADHGMVRASGPHDLPIQIGRWFGVVGESHIIGEPDGRNLTCELTLQGYNTTTLLQSDLDALQTQAGQLTGTLTETISGNSRTFAQCTFLGYAATAPAFLDGSGVNGWVQFGQLLWRQRIRN